MLYTIAGSIKLQGEVLKNEFTCKSNTKKHKR